MKQCLYFLRHGQTWFNVFLRLQGWSNSQLTEEGIRVAKESGKRFAHIPFNVVYSSDISRAMETAQYFLESSGQEKAIHPFPALREVGFGYFEGLDNRQISDLAKVKAIDLGLLKAEDTLDEKMRIDMCHLLDPYHLAEDYKSFQKRVIDGVKEIVDTHPMVERFLLVSHSSAIETVLTGLDKNFQPTAHVENGAICILSHENGKFQVEGYNLYDAK